jgi:hypothetical protein
MYKKSLTQFYDNLKGVRGGNSKEIENERLIESVTKVTELLKDNAHMRNLIENVTHEKDKCESEIFNVIIFIIF